MFTPGKRLRQVCRWFDHFFSSFQTTHSVMKNRWWPEFKTGLFACLFSKKLLFS